ncbi:MAG: twin-arginine translocation signal domain-containing protein [Planctomycetota bacterium]|nr:MAG: twin-arginine translocation signal domain-containing protein [Planctomycetota bacterium]
MSNLMNRREFLGLSAAGAGAVLLAGQLGTSRALAADGQDWPPKLPPVNIRTIYLAKPVPTWPKPNLDVHAEIARLEKHLADTERQLGDVKFVGGDLLRIAADAEKLAGNIGDVEGLLVFNLTSTVGHLLARLVDTGRPTVLFSQLYSGHDWAGVASMQKQGKKVVVLATSDYSEIAEATALMRVPAWLQQTRIVYINNGGIGAERAKEFKEKLGVEVISVDHRRLNEAYQGVDKKAAEAEAGQWIRNAEKVVEPTREEIVKSSRLYLAMKLIMQQEQARAITINCLGLFRQKNLPAYPCLGFCKLNDLGLVGACEADMDSTLTMLIFGYAFGVPGFISDPVIDTATNTVVHAHCVSATKMNGSTGPRCPYIIRSHMEDDDGASLQVKHRVGQVITAAKLVNLDTMLISTGKITGNPDIDRGCRTKIATEVADARKILDNYRGGLHRVIFYGEHVQSIKHLAALMGLKVVEEG